jgi:hypothetical protein
MLSAKRGIVGAQISVSPQEWADSRRTDARGAAHAASNFRQLHAIGAIKS